MYLPHAVFAYVHHNQRVAAMITLKCKTDFALRTDVLQDFGKHLVMQAAAEQKIDMNAPWMFDSSRTVQAVLDETAKALGEPIHVYEVSIHGTNIVYSTEFLEKVKNGLK